MDGWVEVVGLVSSVPRRSGRRTTVESVDLFTSREVTDEELRTGYAVYVVYKSHGYGETTIYRAYTTHNLLRWLLHNRYMDPGNRTTYWPREFTFQLDRLRGAPADPADWRAWLASWPLVIFGWLVTWVLGAIGCVLLVLGAAIVAAVLAVLYGYRRLTILASERTWKPVAGRERAGSEVARLPVPWWASMSPSDALLLWARSRALRYLGQVNGEDLVLGVNGYSLQERSSALVMVDRMNEAARVLDEAPEYYEQYELLLPLFISLATCLLSPTGVIDARYMLYI